MFYKVVVSLPVHEEETVVIDQLKNILYYVEDVAMVLHIARSFLAKKNLIIDLINQDYNLRKRVFVNPESVNTDWGKIIDAHRVNIQYVLDNLDFSKICFLSSNDLLVKKGVLSYLYNYDSGLSLRQTSASMDWWPGVHAQRDQELKRVMRKYNIKSIYGSQIEGSFYDKAVIKKVVQVLQEYNVSASDQFYPREEILIPTFAYHFMKTKIVGKPFIFSEVFRFDRLLWKTRGKLARLDYVVEKLFHKKNYLISKYNDWLFRQKFYKISLKDVKNMINNNIDYFVDYQYFDDGLGKYKLYDLKHLYGLKRINRNYNDLIRTFIRNNSNNYRN